MWLVYKANYQHTYTDVLKKKGGSVELLLQSRFFRPLSKKFVIMAESDIFFWTIAGFGHCKSSHESLTFGMRRITTTW